MKKIKIKNREYNCPTSWSDITIADQIRLEDIKQNNTGLTSTLVMLSAYAKIPVEELRKCNVSILPELMKNLKFVNEPINQDPIVEFKHRGDTFNVIQSLERAEFQDFISLEAARERHGNTAKALPLMIAILCKKKDETLDDYDVEQRAKLFYDLPIDIANRVSVFFYLIEKYSLLSSQTFLDQYQKMTKEEVTRRLEELKDIINKQDGRGLLTLLRKKILLKYVKFLEKNWSSYCNGIQ